MDLEHARFLQAEAERSETLALGVLTDQLAVLGPFDPRRLPGTKDSADTLDLLCRPLRSPSGEPRAILLEYHRVEALERMLRTGGLAELRRARVAASDLGLDEVTTLQRFLDAFITKKEVEPELLNEDELIAALEVQRWAAEAVARAGLSREIRAGPDRDLIEARLALLDVTRAPRKLIAPGFLGRERELAILHSYLDEDSSGLGLGSDPAMMVYGIGGAGKSTLIARLVLDLHEVALRGSRTAWAYLDLDRPTLSSAEPLVLLDDIVRQVGAQIPSYQRAQRHRKADWWRASIGSGFEADDHLLPYLERTAAIADDLRRRGVDSLVVVLDSCEDAQRGQEHFAEQLYGLFAALTRQFPRFRLIVSGRAPVPTFTRNSWPERQLHVLPLPTEQATELLRWFVQSSGQRAARIGDALAAQVIELVGGLPLTIRLAAEVMIHDGIDAIEQDAERARAIDRIRIEFIHGFLYQRILNHLEAPESGEVSTAELRQVAKASLALRRITTDLIGKVLQPVIGAYAHSAPADVFEVMAREVALVEREGDALRLRDELRGPALSALRLQDPRLVDEVHRQAISYYEARAIQPEAATELAYHKLAAGYEVHTVDPAILLELEPFRADFSHASAAALAQAGDSPEKLAAAGELENWERSIAPEIATAIRDGRLELARQLLAERQERTAGTELYRFESQLAELTNGLSGAITAAAMDLIASEAAASPERFTAAAVRTASLRERNGDPGAAAETLKRAEGTPLLAGHLELRLELLLNRMNVGERRELDSEDERWSLSLDARTLISRSNRRRVDANSALTRLLAAALGREEPDRIRRAVREIGLGHQENHRRVRVFIEALEAWTQEQPDPTRLARLADLPTDPDDSASSWIGLAGLGIDAGYLLSRLWDVEPFPSHVREALRMLYLWWDLEREGRPDSASLWELSATRELEDIILTAYPTTTDLGTLADLAGIDRDLVAWRRPARVITRQLLNMADRNQGLEQLIDATWTDNREFSVHPRLRALLGDDYLNSHHLST